MIKVHKFKISEKDNILELDAEVPSTIEYVRIISLEDYLNGNFENFLAEINNDGMVRINHSLSLSEANYKSNTILIACFYESDNEVFKEVGFPNEVIYNKSICYLKEFESNCELPKRFIDYILLTEYIYRSKDYDLNRTLKYWNKLIANVKPENPCNCG